jgi:hypothetical protein
VVPVSAKCCSKPITHEPWEEVMIRWVLGGAIVLGLIVIMGLLNLGVWLLLPFHWLVRRASALARS